MGRDRKYDILFEPLPVGPKTLRNRFWQVPHCNGGGSERPGMQAHFRGMKAEGGWAAVFTEVCTISADADIMPWVGVRLWDAGDVRNLSLMCEKVQEHGSLAGIELCHSGSIGANKETRHPNRVVSQIPSEFDYMASGRAMSKREIRELRRDHVEGFKRARAAGFDLLTLYCGLGTMPIFFLYPFFNKRTDEYGGPFENRIRFTREVLEEIRDEIDDCAIGCRFAIDTLDEPYGFGEGGIRANEEGVQFIAALDELVDYWDINIGTMNFGEDAASSRFFKTNHEAEYARLAKTATQKPVVNVGRFTDPDVMIDVITSGQCDVIGAARPSISDPFLPKKIEEGRLDDIRECIGCNVCISRWEIGGPPIWCTQNATSGEEYRRGWHPERFDRADNADNDVLVIGAGPAGMECAMVLGKRGMRRVHLVDAAAELGGHVRWVSSMPGFAEWGRVISYRRGQLAKLANVEFIANTPLGAVDVLEYGAEYVVVATGSHWVGDGTNGPTHASIPGVDAGTDTAATPEQIMVEGKTLGSRVLVIDTDGYYMGSAIAEKLARDRHEVTLATHLDVIAPYQRYTYEEQRNHERLVQLGVRLIPQQLVVSFTDGVATLAHVWSGEEQTIACDAVVPVTQRVSNCEIYDALEDDDERLEEAGIKGVFLIGDAHTPGMIAQAVFSGHRLAREIDSPDPSVPLPFIRERRLVDPSEGDYSLESGTLAVRVRA
jgi:dimethylamine/trimethylamine dehydrogenase